MRPTFDALLGTIEADIFFSAWNMHKQVSQKANGDIGRIVHEFSTNGAVYDNGRMEESQLHVITAWNIFRWTGDIAFLRQNYAHGQKTWTWLQQHDTNQNGYIEGYGGVEIQGLNAEMLDVQVATQVFLEVMGHMAMTLDDTTLHACISRKPRSSDRASTVIGGATGEPFADFISTKEKASASSTHALANECNREGPSGLGETHDVESIHSRRYVRQRRVRRVLQRWPRSAGRRRR